MGEVILKKRILVLTCILLTLPLSACGKKENKISYTMDTTEEYTAYSYENEERGYTEYIKEYPDAIRTKEDWFDNGHLVLPISDEESYAIQNTNETYATYQIPDEVAAIASTSDLVNIIADLAAKWAPYHSFNYPSDVISILSYRFNVIDIALSRNDFGKSLLDVYIMSEYLPVGSDEDLGYKQDNRLACMEIFLATDYVFDQLTDEQREIVLAEIERKNKQIINGEVICDITRKKSEFYVMIDELIENGGSKWYDYMNQ